MRNGSNWPGFQDFQNTMIAAMGGEDKMEVIPIPRYDTLLYPLAGTLSLNFFSSGLGGGLSAQPGASGGGQSKTLRDTNQITSNGQLPAPQGFFATSLELDIQPGSSAAANTWAPAITTEFNAVTTAANLAVGATDDLNAIAVTGGFQILVNGREYIQDAPLLRACAQRRVRADTSMALNSATTGTIEKGKGYTDGPLYLFPVGLGLQNGVTFNVALNWDALVATPSGKNAKIICYLNGYLFRAKAG
jgi:hypothetical protein